MGRRVFRKMDFFPVIKWRQSGTHRLIINTHLGCMESRAEPQTHTLSCQSLINGWCSAASLKQSIPLHPSSHYHRKVTRNKRLQRVWKEAGKRDGGERRTKGPEGRGYRQLMGSQNCSFRWINLLFLKNPQRQDDREYDSEKERDGERQRQRERERLRVRDYVSFNLVLGLP